MYEKIVNSVFSVIGFVLICVVGFQMYSCTEEQRKNNERSGTVFPIGAFDRIEMKQVQSFRLVARSVVDPDLSRLREMDVLLARLVTSRGFGRIKPMVVELPDLNWKPLDNRPLTYGLPLPEEQSIRISGLPEYFLVTREARPTLCIAVRGPYNWDTFGPAFLKLEEWMRENNTVPTGKPRILLYDLHSFSPADWKKAELQIPVR